MSEDTIMKKIKTWIETCPLFEGDTINVDYLGDDIYSYSIDRTPAETFVKKFTDGNGGLKQCMFDLSITAPISTKAIDNLVNSKFCEDFQEWVYTQNKAKNFPNVDGAFKIECTAPGYVLRNTETTAVYVVQMNFQYYTF